MNKIKCPFCGFKCVSIVNIINSSGPVIVNGSFIRKCEICGGLFQPIDSNSIFLRKHKIERILNRTI